MIIHHRRTCLVIEVEARPFLHLLLCSVCNALNEVFCRSRALSTLSAIDGRAGMGDKGFAIHNRLENNFLDWIHSVDQSPVFKYSEVPTYLGIKSLGLRATLCRAVSCCVPQYTGHYGLSTCSIYVYRLLVVAHLFGSSNSVGKVDLAGRL